MVHRTWYVVYIVSKTQGPNIIDPTYEGSDYKDTHEQDPELASWPRSQGRSLAGLIGASLFLDRS